MRYQHPYHLVQVSPWPIALSLSTFSLLLGSVLLFNNIFLAKEITLLGIASIIYGSYYWFKDIIIEGTYRGEHTKQVEKGLTLGFVLFIVTEVCVFFSLFFSYFYQALVPSIEIGGIWPPIGIITMDYKGVPLLNTLILLSSGFSITASHNFILNRNFSMAYVYLIYTIVLGILFVYCQYLEYFNSFFTLTDSVYGSIFYILTGLHGVHIIIGTIFFIFTLLRFSHFTTEHHVQFTSASIYWHMLDAVWLLLYFLLYCWSL